jgi:hypothetical protein
MALKAVSLCTAVRDSALSLHGHLSEPICEALTRAFGVLKASESRESVRSMLDGIVASLFEADGKPLPLPECDDLDEFCRKASDSVIQNALPTHNTIT